MRDFLLDTQTIKYWYDVACPQHAAVTGNIAAIRKQAVSLEVKPRLRVSVVTLGEIEFGHRVALAPNPAAQAAYMKFVREELPASWEVSEDAVAAYGELRARLFNKYAPGDKRKPKMLPEQLVNPATAKELGIQENDLWIAAQAMAHEMVLVTNDRMSRIREVAAGMHMALLIQNWTMSNSASISQ
ncbi:MAG: type II toxin-antitoxin system VapC family toxin [Phycisphaerales bacterium]|nr:type II toxin-antitoxin system VapC family toxin [Phycisphaerales bacterium]